MATATRSPCRATATSRSPSRSASTTATTSAFASPRSRARPARTRTCGTDATARVPCSRPASTASSRSSSTRPRTTKSFTAYVNLSTKKLVTVTKTITKNGSALAAFGGKVAKSGTSVRLKGGSSAALAGWQFKIPSAVIYKSLSFRVNASARLSAPASIIAMQNFNLCGTWNTGCFDRFKGIGNSSRLGQVVLDERLAVRPPQGPHRARPGRRRLGHRLRAQGRDQGDLPGPQVAPAGAPSTPRRVVQAGKRTTVSPPNAIPSPTWYVSAILFQASKRGSPSCRWWPSPVGEVDDDEVLHGVDHRPHGGCRFASGHRTPAGRRLLPRSRADSGSSCSRKPASNASTWSPA